MSGYKSPFEELIIPYANANKKYTEKEDRFLLCALHKYGLTASSYDKIRVDVRESPHFRFNWFLRSRTPMELKRRCHNLLLQLSNKETAEKKPKAPKPPKVEGAKVDNAKVDGAKGDQPKSDGAPGASKKAQKRKADRMAGHEENIQSYS